MGGKARGIFGTVLTLAAFWATAGGAMIFTASGLFWTGTAIAYGAYSAREARKKADRASQDSQTTAVREGIKTMLRSGVSPKHFVYGLQAMSGTIVFAREPQSAQDPFFWLVLAMPIAHEIQSFDRIWFGDVEVTPLSSDNIPIGGQFVTEVTDTHTITGTIPVGNLVFAIPQDYHAPYDSIIKVDSTSIVCSTSSYVTAPGAVYSTEYNGGNYQYDENGQPIPLPGNYALRDYVFHTPPTREYLTPSGFQDWDKGDEGGPMNRAPDPVTPINTDPNGYPLLDQGNEGGYIYNYTNTPTVSDAVNRVQTINTNAAAYLQPGTNRNVIVPGNVGDKYTLTYTYKFNVPSIQVWRYVGTAEQTANMDLVAACANLPPDQPRWTVNSRLQGIPYLVFKMWTHVKHSFPNGLETITVELKGNNKIAGLNGALGYTENSMLIARHYALARCGIVPGDMDLTEFAGQVAACEEEIKLPEGYGAKNRVPRFDDNNPHEYRYRTNISLSTEIAPIKNLGSILSSCDGSAVVSAVSFDLRAGTFEEPRIAIEDSDWVGAPTITVTPQTGQLWNAVRARYTNADKFLHPMEDAPLYTSQTYLQQDKGRLHEEEVDLLGTNSPFAAQRLIKQMLHRQRNPVRISGTLNTKGFTISPEQTVWVNHTALGMEGKVFRVKTMKQDAPHQITWEGQEDAPILYDWRYNEATMPDPTPNTSLPSVRNVPDIVGLSARTSLAVAAFGQDGRVSAQCRVSWTRVTDMLVLNGGYIELRWTRSTVSQWTSVRLEPTATEHTFPVQRDETIMIQARAANRLVAGRWSDPITKVANDAPSPYMPSGNLIVNSDLLSQPPYPSLPQYNFPPWKVFRVNLETNVLDESSIYWIPLKSRDFSGAKQSFGFNRFGGITPYHEEFARTSRINVVPHKPMVAFFYYYNPHGITSLQIHWYDDLDNTVSIDASPWLPQTMVRLTDEGATDLYQRYGMFAVAPTRTMFARVHVFYRRTPGPTTPVQFFPMNFGQVFFGYAAKGQVTLPPYSAGPSIIGNVSV